MSIATTIAGEELIYFTTAANPPLNGLFSPEPKSPSITKWSGVRVGGTNWVLISWNVTSSAISTSSLLVWQSGESSPFGLKRYTSVLYPFSDSIRATARASPPLLPGPANTVTGVSRLHLFIMAFVSAVAARSMRSIEAIGSCSMVYASSFFILLLGNIFIVMFFLVFALQMYMIILTFPVCYGKKNVLIIDR